MKNQDIKRKRFRYAIDSIISKEGREHEHK
jgi:hypothetical protein